MVSRRRKQLWVERRRWAKADVTKHGQNARIMAARWNAEERQQTSNVKQQPMKYHRLGSGINPDTTTTPSERCCQRPSASTQYIVCNAAGPRFVIASSVARKSREGGRCRYRSFRCSVHKHNLCVDTLQDMCSQPALCVQPCSCGLSDRVMQRCSDAEAKPAHKLDAIHVYIYMCILRYV